VCVIHCQLSIMLMKCGCRVPHSLALGPLPVCQMYEYNLLDSLPVTNISFFYISLAVCLFCKIPRLLSSIEPCFQPETMVDLRFRTLFERLDRRHDWLRTFHSSLTTLRLPCLDGDLLLLYRVLLWSSCVARPFLQWKPSRR
jgi:hypothetical protein